MCWYRLLQTEPVRKRTTLNNPHFSSLLKDRYSLRVCICAFIIQPSFLLIVALYILEHRTLPHELLLGTKEKLYDTFVFYREIFHMKI